MYINEHLIHAYRTLSYTCDDQNQVLNAMICATKYTIKTFKCRSRCWLLRTLRKEGVGTNEVEYGVERVANQLGVRAKQTIKMKVMRGKVSDAYNELRKMEHTNRTQWRRLKRDIPQEVRNEYMNLWQNFMLDYAALFSIKEACPFLPF